MAHRGSSIVALSVAATCLAAAGCDGSSVEPLSESVLLEYLRVGGVEGAQDLLTIYKNGTFDYESRAGRHAGRLEDDELRALERHIANGHYELDRTPRPEPRPVDWLDASCTISRDGETVRIEIDEGPIPDLIRAIQRRAD